MGGPGAVGEWCAPPPPSEVLSWEKEPRGGFTSTNLKTTNQQKRPHARAGPTAANARREAADRSAHGYGTGWPRPCALGGGAEEVGSTEEWYGVMV